MKVNICIRLLMLLAIIFSVNNDLFSQENEKFPTKIKERVSNQTIIVRFEEHITISEIDSILKKYNLKRKDVLMKNMIVVRLPNKMIKKDADEEDKKDIIKIIKDLSNEPNVLFAEPNYRSKKLQVTPNDPGFVGQWGLNNTGQNSGTTDADIDAVEAWNNTTGNSSVIVAIIDSGIDEDHPDLVDNVWTNLDEIPNNDVDDDNNGYVDDVHGWDFYYNDGTPDDSLGHGTHIAGIIGAKGNNGIGVAGVAFNCKLMSLRIFNGDGLCVDNSEIIKAIEYAEANGAKIVNCSFNSTANDNAEKTAIFYSNMLFVCAAGNTSDFPNPNNDQVPLYPASYSSVPNIIAVASTNNKDNLSDFSHYGFYSVDVAAPGEDIISTRPENGVTGDTEGYFDPPGLGLSSVRYGRLSGTSMATPYVCGLAALMLSVDPDLSASEMVTIIKDNVDDLSHLYSYLDSGGRINVNKTLLALRKTITVKTSFTGGKVYVNNSGPFDSPFEHKEFKNRSVDIKVYSPQNYNGMVYAFNYWSDGYAPNVNALSHIFSVSVDATWVADFKEGKYVFLANEYGINNLTGTTLRVDDSYDVISGTGPVLSLDQHTIKTNSETANNPIVKQNNWNGVRSEYKLSHNITVTSSSVTKDAAKFERLEPITIKPLLEGVSIVNGLIEVKDPWYVDANGDQLGLWQPYSSGFYSSTMPNGGIFLNAGGSNITNPLFPYYTVRAISTQVLSGTQSYFFKWFSPSNNVTYPNDSETPVIFKNANETISPIYKGHLRTAQPTSSEAKNQRRMQTVTETGSQQNQQIMVYESMGHVWVTASSDGINWCKEERLSTNSGLNPSISNVFQNTNINSNKAVVVVTWVEGDELFLQSLTFNGNNVYWGWGNGVRSSDNLVNLSQKFAVQAYPRLDSRPVLQIDLNSSDPLLTIAYEGDEVGIAFANLNISIKDNNYVKDIGTQAAFLSRTFISTSTGDKYPVIISTPSVYGYPAKKAIYYLGTGYASGNRIVEYNVVNAVKTVLPIAYGDYLYTYLQGAVSPTNATAVLVAGAQVNTPQGIQYNVNLYGKATYTTGVPTLTTTYTNYNQATVAVQPNSGFGSGTPGYQIYMKNTGTSSWFKTNGASTIGTNISGFFLPEKYTTLANLNSVVNRTSIGGVAATPSVLERYQNSTGTQLSKTNSSLAINVRGFRFFTPINESEQMTILDFSGSKVEIIDSLEAGKLLVAVKVLETSDNGVIVSQNDSLQVSLSVDVVRGGNAIRSYSASEWSALTSQSIGGLVSGDILLFRLPFNVSSSWGYEEVDFGETSIAKENVDEKEGSELKTKEFSVSAYPNPFNPQTTFRITLPNIQFVTLEVYNMLGQKVQTLANGKLEAGEHNFQFNGTTLATGTYIYRLTANDKVQSGKIVLMK